ncbi:MULTISPECIES: MFS transporter [Streptomyces]|uniref:MFS transporter n=2 Tax=Streptomyces rimosus subsp. rimosus TaxID=132474 RepID=A0A8A1UVY1_STRR1|nr:MULTISPECIES: MFS transporter [Streptomyces]QDA05803.1 MFS transporter [Streptomyces rimosus]QEV77080.1 MFS transporter [Streptomyces rimosus]QGY65245.1 MFS transporter [Streptomyces rimosus R6-500]QST82175.1 MFS transporter [Streptomyces rimosus subsp. rimosus ATCC 10970]QTL87915.1 MFS transporter [Streptomyces rimosus subsp. rimosus]
MSLTELNRAGLPDGGADAARPRKLPLAALLALATTVFITSLTETLPAGLLPAMSADLGVGESAAGQTVTVYALGTVLTAIPLSAATARWRRRKLLLTTVLGFALANTVTALSPYYPLTMVARFAAGVAAGLAWALLAGYARRMAPAHLEGRAIAVAMAGIPVALSLGVPAGTFVGKVVGWQVAFLVMTGLTVVLVGWIMAAVPDYPGQTAEKGAKGAKGGSSSMRAALKAPGVPPVLLVTLVFVLAHTILYTYIATFLDGLGMGGRTDVVLLVFGGASLLSIWAVGVLINRRLRALMVAGSLLVAVAGALLALLSGAPGLVYVAVVLWGLGWGGAPTLLQTAAGDAGGEQADAAQAMLVTLWNVAMAGGGVAGGVLLDALGTMALPWSAVGLMVPVVVVVLVARTHGFPARRVGS